MGAPLGGRATPARRQRRRGAHLVRHAPRSVPDRPSEAGRRDRDRVARREGVALGEHARDARHGGRGRSPRDDERRSVPAPRARGDRRREPRRAGGGARREGARLRGRRSHGPRARPVEPRRLVGEGRGERTGREGGRPRSGPRPGACRHRIEGHGDRARPRGEHPGNVARLARGEGGHLPPADDRRGDDGRPRQGRRAAAALRRLGRNRRADQGRRGDGERARGPSDGARLRRHAGKTRRRRVEARGPDDRQGCRRRARAAPQGRGNRGRAKPPKRSACRWSRSPRTRR